MDAVPETATVCDAARLMVKYGVHRAWVLGGGAAAMVGYTPVGCVTATDVLRCVGSAHSRYNSAAKESRSVPIVETPSA